MDKDTTKTGRPVSLATLRNRLSRTWDAYRRDLELRLPPGEVQRLGGEVQKAMVRLFADLLHGQHEVWLERWTPEMVERGLVSEFPLWVRRNRSSLLPDLEGFPEVLAGFVRFLQAQADGTRADWSAILDRLDALPENLARHVASVLVFPGTGGAGRGERSEQRRSAAERRHAQQLQSATAALHAWVKVNAQRAAVEEEMEDVSGEFARLLEDYPALVFEILRTVEQQVATDTVDEILISTYLHPLAFLMERFRYGGECGYAWAGDMIDQFQEQLTGMIHGRRIPGNLATALLNVLHDCRIQVGPDLLPAYQDLMTEEATEMSASPDEFFAAMQGLLQEYRDDVFALAMTLEETIRSMPQDAQSFAIGETLVLSGHDAAMIDAVALLVLSSERNVRMTAVEVLLSMPAYLTPDALRRLIVIRNWLPEGERKGIDAITRAARRKGVECAQWPPVVWQEGDATVAAATYRSALVDGVGNQWLLVLIPSGKRLIWSAVLAKRTVGISDAWSELDVSRKEVAQRLRQIDDLVEVSRAFIDRVIRHYLAVGVEKGVPPSLYLLYTAELIGATDWLPQHMDLRAQLDQLAEAASVPDTADTHQRMLAVRTMQSWFCETSAVDEFLAHTRIRRQDRLLDRLLELHFSDQRALWAEIFMWAALWLLEQKLAPRRAWVSGAVGYLLRMVRMILDGQPLSQIPIMRHIAQRTVWRMRPSTPEGLDFRLLPYQNP